MSEYSVTFSRKCDGSSARCQTFVLPPGKTKLVCSATLVDWACLYLVAFYLLLLVMPIVLHIRQEKHADCVAKRKKNLEGGGL